MSNTRPHICRPPIIRDGRDKPHRCHCIHACNTLLESAAKQNGSVKIGDKVEKMYEPIQQRFYTIDENNGQPIFKKIVPASIAGGGYKKSNRRTKRYNRRKHRTRSIRRAH
jgi:hypothetical protein